MDTPTATEPRETVRKRMKHVSVRRLLERDLCVWYSYSKGITRIPFIQENRSDRNKKEREYPVAFFPGKKRMTVCPQRIQGIQENTREWQNKVNERVGMEEGR